MTRPRIKSDKPALEELSGTRKAAILLMALEQDTAAKLLKVLHKERVEAISREIAGLDYVPAELRDQVVSEFYNLVLARQYADAGGLAWARSLLVSQSALDDVTRLAGDRR